jgi:hypothetical protein
MTSPEQMAAELERLRAENEALKAANENRRRVYLKVSDKGAVSLYGLGRFPVTLYVEQWETILGMADEVRTFMTENAGKLKRKDPTGS